MNTFYSTRVFYLSVIVLSLSAKTNDALQLPDVLYDISTTVDYIGKIFNIASEGVEELSKSLKFSHIVNIHDINILQYKERGTYTRHTFENHDIDIDLHQKVVLIIHGFKSQGTAPWVKRMAIAYHDKGIRNTLAIDWSKISSGYYITACGSTKSVGTLIAAWLFENVLKNDKSLLKKVHLIGHSLGAHIAGFIGSTIYNMTGSLIGRISGLDAAGPFFESPQKQPTFSRLDSSDASYVDGYHTCITLAGFKSPIGHQDFYINYGQPIQPGCIQDDADVWQGVICSHQRAYEVFINAINTNRYLAKKCDNATSPRYITCDPFVTIIMGDNNEVTDIYGEFYVETDSAGGPV